MRPQIITSCTDRQFASSFLRQPSMWHCPHVLPSTMLGSHRSIPHACRVLSSKLAVKSKGSPYSITKCRVLELIPVLGSQPAGDVSHKPGGRLPLLTARPAVTPTTLKRAATNFAAWWTEAQWVWTVCQTASWLRFEPRPFCAWVQHANHLATAPPQICAAVAACEWWNRRADGCSTVAYYASSANSFRHRCSSAPMHIEHKSLSTNHKRQESVCTEYEYRKKAKVMISTHFICDSGPCEEQVHVLKILAIGKNQFDSIRLLHIILILFGSVL